MSISIAGLWNLRAHFYDFCEGSVLRRGPHKAALFREAVGRILFLAVGTGLDIKHFPPGRDIVGIDISSEMLRRAEPRRRQYRGNFELLQADAQNLCLPDGSFHSAVTSCTMCSVPDPVRALKEVYRVLKPGGRLLMFEHVRSRNAILGLALDAMTLWTRIGGTEMNRDTIRNVLTAGFRIQRVESAYLDIVLAIRAGKPY
jgi:ubiquinone/menaquinone biosynthesis C-methylase UbiE